jgi:hypothetical protein
MKFTQIAQSLALIGTTAAAVYSNTSFVPYGTGSFHDGLIVYDVILPNSGFTSFDIKTHQYGYGYVLDSQQISAIYSPSGTPFQVSVTEALKIFDVSADVTLYHEKSVDVTFGGELLLLSTPVIPSNYTAEFIITLKGLPQPIEKRADQEFTITVTATGTTTPTSSSSSSVTTTTTTTATTTDTTTDTTTATKTITTCFDGHCVTLAPVTVTATNFICTECVPISTIFIKTKTNIFTTNNQIITEKIPFTTTEVHNFTTVNPNKPTNAAPVATTTTAAPVAITTTAAPVAPTAAVQTVATPTTVVPVVKTTSVSPAIGTQTATFHGSGSRITGSIFAVFTVLLSMLL